MRDWFVNFFMFFGGMCFFQFVVEFTWCSFSDCTFAIEASNVIVYAVVSAIAGSLRWRELRKRGQG